MADVQGSNLLVKSTLMDSELMVNYWVIGVRWQLLQELCVVVIPV